MITQRIFMHSSVKTGLGVTLPLIKLNGDQLPRIC